MRHTHGASATIVLCLVRVANATGDAACARNPALRDLTTTRRAPPHNATSDARPRTPPERAAARTHSTLHIEVSEREPARKRASAYSRVKFTISGVGWWWWGCGGVSQRSAPGRGRVATRTKSPLTGSRRSARSSSVAGGCPFTTCSMMSRRSSLPTKPPMYGSSRTMQSRSTASQQLRRTACTASAGAYGSFEDGIRKN
jgi:hypothetical protein